jgi:hypothetical protein
MTLDEGNDIGMRPAFGDWLRDRSMAELMSTIIETLNEVQRRGHEPTAVDRETVGCNDRRSTQ